MQSKGGAESVRVIRFSARVRISIAALFVKVSVKVLLDGIPTSSIKYARRVVSVFVFPLPAPAKISNAPSICLTASHCSGFSPLKISLIFVCLWCDCLLAINPQDLLDLHLNLVDSYLN